MLLNEKCKELLAVLFAAGEPLQQERAAQTVGIDGPTAGKLLQHVKDYLEELQLPFTLLRLGDSWQLATLEQYAPVVRQALEIRRGTPLSLNSLADLPPVEQFLDQEGDQLELETGPAGEDKPLQP